MPYGFNNIAAILSMNKASDAALGSGEFAGPRRKIVGDLAAVGPLPFRAPVCENKD